MKNIIIKFFIGSAVLGVCGLLYWYYDSGGGFGAAIVDAPVSDVGSFSGGDSAPLADAGPAAPAESDTPDAPSPTSQVASANDDAPDAPVASGVPAPAAAPTSVSPPQACSFSDAGGNPSREVLLNEIAWMGSLPADGETSAKAGEREWIELKNISSGTIDLSGWQILDAAGSLKIVLGGSSPGGTEVSPGGFFLLVRDGASLTASGTSGPITISADAGYSGGLSNAGDKLALLDANCGVSDFLDASTGWPGGSNTTKQTLERDADGDGWHTSAAPGGTPRAENSAPPPPQPPLQPSAPSQYSISVELAGGGVGTVSSNPAGILCGSTCEGNFAAGTAVGFTAAPSAGSEFAGWSGGCNSTATTCSVTVSNSLSLAADFEQIPIVSSSDVANFSDASAPPDNSSPVGGASAVAGGHLLIAQVQIAGAASSNDFVKIFNPTGAAVDISGWKLHKKSSTGADYSLKSFATGSMIAPGGYFTWANSEDGFADSIGADASSTETLSADNSVALFDANGNIVDQIAWGTGTNQYAEGTAYPTDPTASQVLARTIANGTMIDTDNNASDFAIQ